MVIRDFVQSEEILVSYFLDTHGSPVMVDAAIFQIVIGFDMHESSFFELDRQRVVQLRPRVIAVNAGIVKDPAFIYRHARRAAGFCYYLVRIIEVDIFHHNIRIISFISIRYRVWSVA